MLLSHYFSSHELQILVIYYFRKQTFNFAFINNQFTTDDYEKPVHPFIDDQLFFEIDPSISKKANFYVQNAEASLEDTLLQLGWSNDINFHQIQNVRYYDDDYNSADGFIIAVFIRADKMYDSYSRQVTDILTLLGESDLFKLNLTSIYLQCIHRFKILIFADVAYAQAKVTVISTRDRFS